MKQETPKNGKKWIWLVAAVVLVLTIVGVVLALVLGGSGAHIVMDAVQICTGTLTD